MFQLLFGKDASDQTVYNNSVLQYMENGKYGLLSFDGEKITEPIYEEMRSLTDKYGEILIKKDGKYGVINIKGTTMVKNKYDYIKGDGYVHDGSHKDAGYIVGIKSNQGMQYGYIDKEEKEIIKISQESIYRIIETKANDVYLIASQNGRYALYKNKDNLTDYKYIDMNYNPASDTITVQKNKSFGLINLSGEVIVPAEYDELIVVGIYIKVSKDGTNYTYDLNGKLNEKPRFASLQLTSTGKYYISINEDYRYGIADKDRNVVIPNEYDYIYETETTGLLIATLEDDVTIYSGNAKEIISAENAEVSVTGNYIGITTPNDLYYLTVNGKKVDNKTVYLDNNIYASKIDGKWGFVDLRDNEVVPYIYDEVTEINEYGFAGIKKNGKWGVINKNGEIILEPTYENNDVNPTFIGKYILRGNIVTDE